MVFNMRDKPHLNTAPPKIVSEKGINFTSVERG